MLIKIKNLGGIIWEFLKDSVVNVADQKLSDDFYDEDKDPWTCQRKDLC